MTCTYLTSEHGTEIVTASSQHNPMGREVFLLHPQCHITKGAALPEGVHWVEDGLGVSVCHYVFRGHNAAHQALWRKNRGILGQYSYMKDHIWRNEKMNTRWAVQIKELKKGLPSTQKPCTEHSWPWLHYHNLANFSKVPLLPRNCTSLHLWIQPSEEQNIKKVLILNMHRLFITFPK